MKEPLYGTTMNMFWNTKQINPSMVRKNDHLNMKSLDLKEEGGTRVSCIPRFDDSGMVYRSPSVPKRAAVTCNSGGTSLK